MSHEANSTEDKQAQELPQKSDETSLALLNLRIWPALLLLGGMVLLKYLPTLMPEGPPQLWMSAAFGPLACGVLIAVWWILASRASLVEKCIGIIGLVAVGAVVTANVHETMRGPAMMMVTVPMGMAGFALGAIFLSKHLSVKRTLVALILAMLGFGFSLTLRNEGMWGGFDPIFDWRWNQSAEEKFLAENQNQIKSEKTMAAKVDSDLLTPEWSGFRGNDRSGVVSGIKIETDWTTNPPQELWRVNVGPGWGSFAVAGDLLFTQEQRGEQECIVCYQSSSGAEYWTHEIKTRFYDPLGGPGPRATPILADGNVFAMGASGILTCVDAKSGKENWSVDIRQIANVEPPMWGFSASPLVVGDVVITYAAGTGDLGTMAFNKENGELAWSAPAGRQSYSSPHLCKIKGKQWVVMTTDLGLDFIDAKTGKVVSTYDWKQYGYRSLQPYVIDEDSILLPTGLGAGTRRVKFDEELNGKEVWTTMALKPDFNDLVVYDGHVYGFDQTVFTCIDIETGERKWKRGRYGKGQCVLIEDSGVVLVLTEKGDLVMVNATPDKHLELGKMKALANKTWNHPVMVGNRLYIRNDREAVCYELSGDVVASRSGETSNGDSLVP